MNEQIYRMTTGNPPEVAQAVPEGWTATGLRLKRREGQALPGLPEGWAWLPEVRAEGAPTPGMGESVVGLADAVSADGLSVETGRWELVEMTAEELGARRVAEADMADSTVDAGLVRRVLRERVLSGPVTDEELGGMAGLFDAWRPWVSYEVGQELRVPGEDAVVRVVQAHTSQPDWLPLELPALYTRLGAVDPGSGLAAWVQPLGGYDAYAAGAEVTHAGQSWRSDVGGNVWEPGVYGWSVI